MTVIRIAGFGGENRAIHPKLMPESVGVTSLNQKPGRGDLRSWRSPLTVASIPGGRNTIYRMGRDVASDSDYWLNWTGLVHAVRGFDAEDTTERTYYTGDGTPKVTDNTLALASAPYPTAHRPMSLPAPVSAPSVTAVAPAVTTETLTRTVVSFEVLAGVLTVKTAEAHGFEAGDVATINMSNGYTGTHNVTGALSSTVFTASAGAGDVALTAMDDGDELPWVLHDNTVSVVGRAELREALRLAGSEMAAVWIAPYVQP